MKAIVVSPDIMGGEAVFDGTRLTVRRIGRLLERGLEAEVREDYPYLDAEDLDLARRFVAAERYLLDTNRES